MEEIAAALLEIYPDATRASLGQHEVFRFKEMTPAYTFECVVKAVNGVSLIELTARDSFDEALALWMLDQVASVELPPIDSAHIRVTSARFPKPWNFQSLVTVPPLIAERFKHQSEFLENITYWVVPAFRGEFNDRDGGRAFWHQIYRKDGWNVPVIRWDRSPKRKPIHDQ
jgi:hypothetical protein